MSRETIRLIHGRRRSRMAIATVRRGSDEHPMIRLGAIISMLFIWAFLPVEGAGSRLRSYSSTPVRSIHDVSTTRKTSRLPAYQSDSACKGQAWGSESLECLTMIAHENGKAEHKIRVVVAALPAGLDTPNIL